MGLFDKLKAAVGVGQPNIDIILRNTNIEDDQLIHPIIAITAQSAKAEIDEVKMEFVRKQKITYPAYEENGQSHPSRVEEEEHVLYRIVFKGDNYEEHFEHRFDPETRELIKFNYQRYENASPSKLIIEPNQKHEFYIQFCIDIYNVDKANMDRVAMYDVLHESSFFIRVTADMPGLDPKKEIPVSYKRTF